MATQAINAGVCRSSEASIGGVCAGLAERFDLDPIVVRILAVLITLMTAGLGLVAYIVLWVRLPRSPMSDIPYEVTPESAESSSFGCVDCVTGRAAVRPGARAASGMSLVARLSIAVGLMLLFLVVAVNLSPLLPGTEWWQFWPLAFVITGLCLIVIPVPTRYEAAWHALGIAVASTAVTLLPISVNLVAWETLPYAFSKAWLLIALAVAMFALGLYRKSDALTIGSAVFLVAFCVFALSMCALPGDAQSLLLNMPDGRSFKIAISGI